MNRTTTAGTALAGSLASERHDAESAALPTTTNAIAQAAGSVLNAERCNAERVAVALGHTVKRWREPKFAPRRATVAGLASALGMSAALLDESLDALLEPVTAMSLEALAVKLPVANRLVGFVMPGNVPGAGIHEVCAALLAGAGLIVKTASGEPLFFVNFMRTLAEVDAAVGARVAVVNFGRSEATAMRELWARCDGGVVAYGD
ncbi:MAG TPA: acyl-CoA reductase, partial [Candidatus Binataceae bacterium]|nr:acyl-CoA reductase [Candidatus Binataceae bacterium]